MINRLTTTAVFKTSGATLAADYQPQTGITAVVGENGAGKTFLSIEAVRWLLYGKAALRGAAADYKDASVSGSLTIRGARYEVHRGKGGELVMDQSGDIVARGAEKVSEYMLGVIGYPLDVFDLCNAATQGNVQKLGDLRPAERKALIDKVVRLTEAEATEKACREEAAGYRREVEALTKVLRTPGDAPTPPKGYFPSTQSRADIAILRRTMDQAEKLRAQLRHVDEPVAPAVSEFSEDAIAALQDHEDQRRRSDAECRELSSIPAPMATEWSEDQLVAAEARARVAHAIEQRGAAPQLTAEQSEHNWAAWAIYDAYRPSDTVECPKCHNRFEPTGVPPQQPAWTKTALREDDARRAKHAAPAPVLPDGPDLTQQQIDHARRARTAREAFDKAQARLNELVKLEDRSAALAQMRADKSAVEVHTMALLNYERVTAANSAVEQQIAALGRVPTQDELSALYERLREAEAYEAGCRAYDAEKAAFDDTQAKITEAQHLADEYAAGGKDIAAARAAVKALIAPRISRIASQLVLEMSRGKLRDLVVTDDMDITVGGQRIETLSGAGKTVANLALRVAMGRALVGHVFPVFLADEIDGDLSASRRAATLEALVSLKTHMDQIILVTHRGVDIADHVWRVDESTT